MSAREMTVWQHFCDVCCQYVGPMTIARDSPPMPEGWSGRTLGDCGLTGYTRHDSICPACTRRIAERDAAALGREEAPNV